MKIRTGFVSNSSSSSFIVWIDKKDVPKTAEELQKLMFGSETTNYCYDELADTSDIAGRVFNDMQDEKNKTNDILNNESVRGEVVDMGYGELESSVIGNRDDFFKKNFGCKNYEDEYKYKHYLGAILGYKKLIEKEKELKDKAVYYFIYADDAGEAWLEHGDIFRNLNHVRISHH